VTSIGKVPSKVHIADESAEGFVGENAHNANKLRRYEGGHI